MRKHLEMLSTWHRAMTGGAALIALFQLGYLLYLMYSGPAAPTAPAHPPKASEIFNPVQSAYSDTGVLAWKIWASFALIVALINAGLNWLAALCYRSAEQYNLLVGVAVFNLIFGAIMFNHWLPATLGLLLGVPTALYAVGILIGDEAKKVFRLVSTGRSLEEALSGRPALSGQRVAVTHLETLEDDLAGAAAESAERAAQLSPGKRKLPTAPEPLSDEVVTYDLDAEVKSPPAPQPTAKLSGARPAPGVSGGKPAPKVSGQRPVAKENPPARE